MTLPNSAVIRENTSFTACGEISVIGRLLRADASEAPGECQWLPPGLAGKALRGCLKNRVFVKLSLSLFLLVILTKSSRTSIALGGRERKRKRKRKRKRWGGPDFLDALLATDKHG
jgi:hypothetical protein